MSSTITNSYSVEVGASKPNFALFPLYDLQSAIAGGSARLDELFTIKCTVRVPDDQGNSYFVDVVQNFKLDPRKGDYMKQRDDMIQKFVHDAYMCLMCTKVDPNAEYLGRKLHVLDHDKRTERERMKSTLPSARPHLVRPSSLEPSRKLAPGELPF